MMGVMVCNMTLCKAFWCKECVTSFHAKCIVTIFLCTMSCRSWQGQSHVDKLKLVQALYRRGNIATMIGNEWDKWCHLFVAQGLFYLLLALSYHINATFEDATVESDAIIGTHQTMTFRDSHRTKHILICWSIFCSFPRRWMCVEIRESEYIWR
jgi:hypothetical protein